MDGWEYWAEQNLMNQFGFGFNRWDMFWHSASEHFQKTGKMRKKTNTKRKKKRERENERLTVETHAKNSPAKKSALFHGAQYIIPRYSFPDIGSSWVLPAGSKLPTQQKRGQPAKQLMRPHTSERTLIWNQCLTATERTASAKSRAVVSWPMN